MNNNKRSGQRLRRWPKGFPQNDGFPFRADRTTEDARGQEAQLIEDPTVFANQLLAMQGFGSIGPATDRWRAQGFARAFMASRKRMAHLACGGRVPEMYNATINGQFDPNWQEYLKAVKEEHFAELSKWRGYPIRGLS